MKKLLLSVIICLSCMAGITQPYDPSKVNKKAIPLYEQALERAGDGHLPQAAGLLLKCIELDARYADAYLSLAGVYGQMKNYRVSTDYYEKAFAIDTAYTMDYKLPYSINLAGDGQFEKALAAINELLDKKPPRNPNSLKAAQYRKRSYEFAVEYARRHANDNYVFAPQNAGPEINTAQSEYFPSLTIDSKELIFTRVVNDRNEDFYSSVQQDDKWQPARPLSGGINTVMNEGAQTISQDGQWVIFTACTRPDGFGSCDLYISYLDDRGWSEASNLGGTINSQQWESQPSLSPDKKDLYFASRRPGGYGGADIYVSHLQPNGKWSTPENLGPQINTSGDDQCPFIHADNQTLYFTSNGWPGYGDDDLFYVRKGPGGDWSTPENLGYPINTINKEGTLFVTTDGNTAWYASDRADSRGGWDIYHFELRESVKPLRTLWVRGRVYDKKTEKGLPSGIELIDLSSGKPVSTLQTDEKGQYLVTLPIGKDYAFNVNRKNYLFYSDNFMLSREAPDSTYEKNIALQPLEANASVVLNNIFFDLNKFELKPESKAELDKVVLLLQENPTLKIEISGHTDNIGKPADNQVLSNNRAKAVVSYLINSRIAANRLTYKGYGEKQPIDDNNTENGRAKNRRTELKVLSL